MQFDVINTTGEVVGSTNLDESVWGIEPHLSVVHQALLRQLANARLGTSKTKGRSEVSGGGRKPWRQKGTGRARQGSTRSPQWVGGGVVFGPTPRKYTQAMPRKMRRLAIRSVLSAKLRDERLSVVQGMEELDGKTKSMKTALAGLPESRSMLLVVPSTDSVVARGTANLPNTKTIVAGMLNVRDMLKFDRLVVMEEAVSHIEELWALDEASRQPSQWKLDRQAVAEEVA
jgi:large subunit ribosomal protein L4